MGNFTSCCFLHQSNLHTAMILDAHGNHRRVNLPITAAELMVEESGHLVCSVAGLRRTRRIQAMRADDELLAGENYLMVPVNRVKCKVSEQEMAVIKSACEKRLRGRGSSKILPAEAAAAEGESKGRACVLTGEEDAGFPGCRLGNFRPWSPVLEPIYEGY